jgi:beta-glucosidase
MADRQQALADVIFGDYNPGGRLPVTFYKSVEDLPGFSDYKMANRTYRYFTGNALYPFGYGLSYTTFKYSKLSVGKNLVKGDSVTVSIKVTNTGKLAGDEVVQLYLSNPDASVPVPIRSLKGFKRIHLLPGETKTVSFIVTPDAFSVIDEQNKRVVNPGEFEFSAGGCQPQSKAGVKEPGILKKTITLL